MQVADLEHAALGGAVVAGLGALLDVATGAERLVARAGEDDSLHAVVGPRSAKRVDQLLDGAATEGVVPVRPVDPDHCRRVVDGVVHILVVSHISQADMAQSPIGSPRAARRRVRPGRRPAGRDAHAARRRRSLDWSREGSPAGEHPPCRGRCVPGRGLRGRRATPLPERGRAVRPAGRGVGARDPLQHQDHSAGAGSREGPAGRRVLLHRDQPGGPGRCGRARRRRLQRAVLQHPQRRRAGARRDRRVGAQADREVPSDARRHLGQVGEGQPRDPRPHARHRRLRQHRHPAVQRRRGRRPAGDLLRHRRPAGPRQRPPGRQRWTSCWPSRTS